MIKIKTPLTKADLEKLKAGDIVLLTGTIYTARDAAHGRLLQLIEKGSSLPLDLQGTIIYYAGPTPTKEGQIIGSIGPTTSSRMDPFMRIMCEQGMIASIGKGNRDKSIIELCKEFKTVYFLATGGAGALLSKKVRHVKTIAFDDLGCEAIRQLDVEDFPLIVGYDTFGNSCLKEN